MNPEEAKARAKALLAVIEASYAIRIVNLEGVIEAITAGTQDEEKILAICTAVNTWVAINAPPSGEVEIPLGTLQSLVERLI